MSAITAYDLSKAYGNFVALHNFYIDLPEGSIHGVVGSENSGKTTALRLLGGLCRPNFGECKVLGFSPYNEMSKVHSITGVVTESAKLYKNISVSENLYFFASLYGVNKNDAIDRASFLLHRLDIWETRAKKVDELTSSTLIRVNLARALMHKPRILLMDEPVFGMNRETTDAVKDIINYIVSEEEASAVLFTRHLMHAQEICQNFTIMNKGSVISNGSMESLRRGCGLKNKSSIVVTDDSIAPDDYILSENGSWEREIDNDKEMPNLVKNAINKGCEILEAKIVKPTLEDIYKSYILRTEKAGESYEYESIFEGEV